MEQEDAVVDMRLSCHQDMLEVCLEASVDVWEGICFQALYNFEKRHSFRHIAVIKSSCRGRNLAQEKRSKSGSARDCLSQCSTIMQRDRSREYSIVAQLEI